MATLKSFADTLENELTCPICVGVFADPRSLPCLHTFCEKCIAEWFERSGNPITKRMDCPVCKTRTDVPDGDPSKLRKSFYLDTLLHLLHAMKTKASQQGLSECANCDQPRVLVAVCPQCNGLICGICVDAHKTIKQVRDEHQPMMLNQFKQENVDTFMKTQNLCKQKFHEKNKLEFYCQEETCKTCICQKCLAIDHQNHRVQIFEEAVDDSKQDMKQNMKQVKQRIEKYQQELQKSKENINRIEKEHHEAQKEVDNNVQIICMMANEHGRKMKEELNQTLHEQRRDNQEEQSLIETCIKQLSEYELHCQTMLERGLQYEIIENKKVVQERCQVLSEAPSVLSTRPVSRNITVGYAVTTTVMESLRDIGKIVKNVVDIEHSSLESPRKGYRGLANKFHIITRNAEGEACPTRIESIDVKIKDVDDNEVQKKVFEEEDGKYGVKYKPEKSGEYEIQVNIGGHAIQNSPKHVKILDVHELFEPRETIGRKGTGKGELWGPESISVSDNGEMAIADCCNHRIQIFSLDGKYLRQFGSKGTGEGQLYLPFGVVFNEDRIIVSDNPDNKGRIQEFDLNGTYVRTVYRHEQWLRGMCVNDDKNIAVCCWGNKELGIKPSIKVFGKQGDIIHQLDMTHDDEQPVYITYGNEKYFVSCPNKHCVCVFNKNGVFLYKFGEQGERDGQFKYPRGLAVYGPDMILVCDCDNHRVQLVTQDGQFIKSFGSHGSGVGQMNCPVDVVVTADGRVFVVEYYGHKFSVWY